MTKNNISKILTKAISYFIFTEILLINYFKQFRKA